MLKSADRVIVALDCSRERALELAGVPVGPARRPVAETTPEVDDRVRAMLDHYGIAHE